MELAELTIYPFVIEDPVCVEDNIHADLIDVGRKAYPLVNSDEGRMLAIEWLIMRYVPMWMDIRNVELATQRGDLRQRKINPLYTDFNKEIMHPNLNTRDKLVTFKEYLRFLAEKQKTRDRERDWRLAKYEIAELLWEHIGEKLSF